MWCGEPHNDRASGSGRPRAVAVHAMQDASAHQGNHSNQGADKLTTDQRAVSMALQQVSVSPQRPCAADRDWRASHILRKLTLQVMSKGRRARQATAPDFNQLGGLALVSVMCISSDVKIFRSQPRPHREPGRAAQATPRLRTLENACYAGLGEPAMPPLWGPQACTGG